MTADASGIVLAGGRSVRFGGDKLSAVIDGRALLDRAVDPLAMALRRNAALTAARLTLGHGDRSLLALLDGVRVATVPEHAWRALDPDGATLLDVDVPADLPAGRSAGRPAQREFRR